MRVSTAWFSSPRPLALAFLLLSDAAASAQSLLPGALYENRGQWTGSTRFQGVAGETRLRVERDGFCVASPEDAQGFSVVRFRLPAGDGAVVEGSDTIPGLHHFFLGKDPAAFARDVRAFRSVVWRGAAPGVDFLLFAHPEGAEYVVHADPASGAGVLEFSLEGVDDVRVLDDGSAELQAGPRALCQSAPLAWTHSSAGDVVQCRAWFEVAGTDRLALCWSGVGDGRVVVDPGLDWATWLGGTVPAPGPPIPNEPRACRSLDDGTTVLAGATGRIDFPTTPGSYSPLFNGGNADAFVTRVAADGASLVFSTYLGGSVHSTGGGGYEEAWALGIAMGGSMVLSGMTASMDFPFTPGAFHTPDATTFVVRLGPMGDVLEYAAGLGTEYTPTRLAVAQDGSVVLTGGAIFGGIPVTAGAFQALPKGLTDGWVVGLSADASSIRFGTYLGGTKNDGIPKIAIRSDGVLMLTGSTQSPDFPTTPGAYQQSLAGESDIVFLGLDALGQNLLFSTLLGGAGSDSAAGIGLDPHEGPVLAGVCNSFTFPTTPGAFMTECVGLCVDGFVARFNDDGSALHFSTLFGGGGGDAIQDFVLDGAGHVTGVGLTSSAGFVFPITPGALFPVEGPPNDHFIFRLDRSGRRVHYGSFLPGDINSNGTPVVASGPDGAATMAAREGSSNLPVTPGAFDPVAVPGKIYVSRWDLLPFGVTKLGTSTPGCKGALPLSVSTQPRAGHGDFSLLSWNAPALGTGFLVIGFQSLAAPLVVSGAPLFVDPSGAFAGAIAADDAGVVEVPIPLRASIPPGTKAYAQLFFPDVCAPGGLAASHALEIVVQP